MPVISVAVGTLLAFSAGTAFGATPAASSRVSPRVMTCAGKVVFEPSSYVISCADANSGLVAAHWTLWTSSEATALAVYSANDCTPTCAAGKFQDYPAAVSFSAPKLTKYGTLYSQLKVLYLVGSKVHSVAMTLPLRPL